MNKDLPYTSLEQEIHVEQLIITGAIPPWLSGVLIRNGPAKFEVGSKKLHWLDGLAMLHAFTFQEGRVSYTNQFIKSDFYKTVYKKGKLPYRTFASDPCKNLFKTFFSFFYSLKDLPLCAQNTNVNITKIAEKFIAMTEVPLSIEFDPQTLDTLGVFQYEDHLEQKLRFETAHPHYDPLREESVNYYVKYGPQSSYHLFKVSQHGQKRELIACLPAKKPAYMHSFALTKDYIVLVEFPFVVNPLKLLLQRKPFIQNFRWEPERGTQFHVVKRETGLVVGSYKGEAYFAFHHVNAFEKENGLAIDIVTYENPSFIFDGDMLLNSRKKLTRFELSFDQDRVSSRDLSSCSFEMPRIHYKKYNGLPYQYVYGVGGHCELVKVDVQTGQAIHWNQEGCFAGEPVFVPYPDTETEDGGVVLSVVLDCIKETSFLLILEAKNFQEIARAEVPHPIPLGLHGTFFPQYRYQK